MNKSVKCAFMATKKSLLVILLAITSWAAQAALPGTTCRSAIPLTKDFADTIRTQPVEKWYSAWTFDLPLAVAFIPDDGESAPAPEVEMDFSCVSGYYTDSILCSLFCKTSSGSGFSFEMPYKQALEKGEKDGKFAYTISFGKRYRDLLLQVGISYNVPVVVRVKYKCKGILCMNPDAFTNCMDGPKFVKIGDTIEVAAKDKERHVIYPYVQWQEDTIVFSWTGTTPCTMSVANDCDFDPLDNSNPNMIQFVENIQPGTSVKAEATTIYDWVHNPEFPNQAGMYYAKFYSEEPGVMKITKAEQAPPDKGATILRFGKTYALDANSEAIYAIPRSWNLNTILTTPTAHLFSMVLSTTADFGEGDTLKLYTFDKSDNGRWKGIFGTELKSFWNKVPYGQHYLYIRFSCTEATTISPDRWAVSECYEKWAGNLVVPGQELTITKNSSTIYRFSYPQWVGGDMTITFNLNSNCEVYLADTCGFAKSNADAPYWLKHKAIVKSTQPLVITADEIASWKDQIDEEGIFYALFNSSANGTRKLTFNTTAPKDADPVYPHTSVSVECNEDKNVFVHVSENQPIVVTDVTDTKVDEWEAVVGEKHALNLQPGTYTISGKNDKIVVNL